jgi:succinate dehydrogenase/fumarate reductase cytochrome b subunit
MEPGNHQHQPRRHLNRTGRRYILNHRDRSPWWVWVLVMVATVLATGLIAAGGLAVGVFTIYTPEQMYLQVWSACISFVHSVIGVVLLAFFCHANVRSKALVFLTLCTNHTLNSKHARSPVEKAGT